MRASKSSLYLRNVGWQIFKAPKLRKERSGSSDFSFFPFSQSISWRLIYDRNWGSRRGNRKGRKISYCHQRIQKTFLKSQSSNLIGPMLNYIQVQSVESDRRRKGWVFFIKKPRHIPTTSIYVVACGTFWTITVTSHINYPVNSPAWYRNNYGVTVIKIVDFSPSPSLSVLIHHRLLNGGTIIVVINLKKLHPWSLESNQKGENTRSYHSNVGDMSTAQGQNAFPWGFYIAKVVILTLIITEHSCDSI